MAEIIWSPQAIADVEAIRDYITRDSSHFGNLVAQRIVAAVERLGKYPESGRIVPEFGDSNLREVIWAWRSRSGPGCTLGFGSEWGSRTHHAVVVLLGLGTGR